MYLEVIKRNMDVVPLGSNFLGILREEAVPGRRCPEGVARKASSRIPRNASSSVL